jgi:hypothetical protein
MDYSSLGLDDKLRSVNSLTSGTTIQSLGFENNYELPTGAINYTNLSKASRPYDAVVSLSGELGTFKDIQLAINYVNSIGGGTVFISNGTYIISEDITVYSNIRIVGEDQFSTILDFNNSTKYIKVIGTEENRLNNVIFEKFSIINSLAWESGFISVIYLDNIKFDSLYFGDCYDSSEKAVVRVKIYSVTNCTVKSCFSDNAGIISVENYCEKVSIVENLSKNALDTPITLIGGSGITISQNYILNCSLGISCDNSESIITENNIDTCLIGIRVLNGKKNIIIANNTISPDTNATAGVLIGTASGSECIISSNQIIGLWTTGISLVNGDKNIITSNIITGSTTGILIDANSDRNIVVANFLYGSATPITDSGSNTTAANNIVA